VTASLASSGAQGIVTTGASQVIIFVLRIVGLIVLARLIAPADFGHFIIVSGLTMMVLGLVFVGLPMAANQALNLTRETQTVLMVINTALGLAVSAVLSLSAPLIAAVYAIDELQDIARWLALYPLVSGLRVHLRVHLTRQLRFGVLAVLEVVALAVSTACAIALAVAGFGVLALVSQLLVQSFVELMILIVVSRWRPVRPRLNRHELRELVHFGSHVASANIVRSLSTGAILPIAAFSLTPASLANFDKAHQQAVMPVVFAVTRSGRVAIPVLSALRDDPERLLAYFRRAHLILATVTCTALLVLAGLSVPLVNVLLGPQWQLAGQLLQILAIGNVFRTLAQSLDWIYYSSSNSAHALRATLWAYPFVAVVTLLGLVGGPIGMAMAHATAWIVLWPILTIRAVRVAGGAATPIVRDAVRVISLLGVPAGLAGYGMTHVFSTDALALVFGGLAAVGAMALSAALVPAIRRDIGTVISVIRLGLARRR
jgi:PST family polysaccharide transporter